jgi:GntR family transcriptional regulator
LNHDSPEPYWQQLAARLREQIEGGTLAGKMPSARSLASAYGVSRETAGRAVAALRDAGLVVTVRGRGTFVVPRGE